MLLLFYRHANLDEISAIVQKLEDGHSDVLEDGHSDVVRFSLLNMSKVFVAAIRLAERSLSKY